MDKPKNFDKARAKAFTGKVTSDVAGAVTLHLCAIGDRLSLFKDLAENGPAARRTASTLSNSRATASTDSSGKTVNSNPSLLASGSIACSRLPARTGLRFRLLASSAINVPV